MKMVKVQYLNLTFKEMFNSDLVPRFRLVTNQGQHRSMVPPEKGLLQRQQNMQYDGIRLREFCQFLSLTCGDKSFEIIRSHSKINPVLSRSKSQTGNSVSKLDISGLNQNEIEMDQQPVDPFLRKIYF